MFTAVCTPNTRGSSYRYIYLVVYSNLLADEGIRVPKRVLGRRKRGDAASGNWYTVDPWSSLSIRTPVSGKAAGRPGLRTPPCRGASGPSPLYHRKLEAREQGTAPRDLYVQHANLFSTHVSGILLLLRILVE